MKYTAFLVLIMLVGVTSVLAQDQLIVEGEKQTEEFIKEFKQVDLNDIYDIQDSRLLGIYENTSRSGLQKSIVFRKLNESLKQIRANEQELPEGFYMRYTHQFGDGTIMAILFEDLSRSSDVNLYLAPVDQERLKIDLRNKTKVGTFTIGGKNKRALIRKGNLFNVVNQRGSEFVAIVNNETIKRNDIATKSYLVFNKNLKVVNSGNFSFDVRNKDMRVDEYTISETGNIYCTYTTYVDDNRAGDDSFIAQLTTGKTVRLDDEERFLNNPTLSAQDGQVILLGTYSIDRKSRVKGRTQGIYMASISEADLSIEKESYNKYPKELLSNLFNDKSRKVENGVVGNALKMKYLRHLGGAKYAFVMEHKTVRYVRDRNGNVVRIIYSSNEAICGVVDRESSEFDWINLVSKVESTNNVDRVGLFPYINEDGNLCVVFNSTKKKEKANSRDIYVNRNLKNTSIMQLTFDEKGKITEESLVEKANKEFGFVFDSGRSMQDAQSQRIYLVLSKRGRSFLRIATLE